LTTCDERALKKLYHEIIKYEAGLLSGLPSNEREKVSEIPCYISADKSIYEDYCVLRRTDYSLGIEELKNIAKIVGVDDACIYELIRRGFLIPVLKENNQYRSFHMDTLIRAGDVRIKPGGGKMILQSLFLVGEHYIDDFSQAFLMPRSDGVEEEKELYELLSTTLGGELTNVYISVLQEYLKERGAHGLTYFQLKALKEIIISFRGKNTYVIVAPAGSGKTEIFLFVALYKLLLDIKNSVRRKVMIVYPRKFLEVDQSERVIKLIKILNDKLEQTSYNRVFTIAIRDGDTRVIEDEVNARRKSGEKEMEFRGIKCGQNGSLVIQISSDPSKDLVACKDADGRVEAYPFVKWSRLGSKEADILITNLHTLFFRVIARSDDDLDVFDILERSPMDMIIFDEVHEYEPAELGLLYYTLKTLNYIRALKGLEPLKVILSSATIANAADLARELVDEDALVLNYSDVITRDHSRIEILEKSGKIGLTKKLVILGILTINPTYSWETYTSQLAITLLFMNRVLDLLGKGVKQAVVFLNNVRELNRVHAIIENDLQLGSPLDNACLRGSWGQILDPIKSRYSICHYTYMLETTQNSSTSVKEFLEYVRNNNHAKEHLFPRLTKIFSGTPLEERLKLVEDIYRKNVYIIVATSSLELGVDYPGVSIVANIGFNEKLPSIIQRFGRAGRRLSDTLNTTLALLIVRNNPLEYTRLFEALKNKTISIMLKGSLTPELIKKLHETSTGEIRVEVARDLSAIKRLGLLRSTITIMALKNGYHGLKAIRNEDEECRALTDLRRYISDYREQLVKLFYGADKIAESILGHELRFKDIQECKEYYSVLKQRDACLDFLQECITKSNEAYRVLDGIAKNISHDSINNWRSSLNTLKERCNNVLKGLQQKDRLTDEDFKFLADKIKSLDFELIQLCNKILNDMPSLISNLLSSLSNTSIKYEYVKNIYRLLIEICENISEGRNPCILSISKK